MRNNSHDDSSPHPRENHRPAKFVAILPAKFVVPSALPAKLEAWLNLSQREKASVFIMVRTRAMTGDQVSIVLLPTQGRSKQV